MELLRAVGIHQNPSATSQPFGGFLTAKLVIAKERGSILPLQKLQLVRLAVPFGGICERFAARGNHWPLLGELGVEGDKIFLAGRDIVFGVNGFGRAFGFAEGAIDAFVGVNHEEIRAFVEAIDRANFNTIGVFAADTVINDDEWHSGSSRCRVFFKAKWLIWMACVAYAAGFCSAA